MSVIGNCLTARGVKPVINYKQAFKNTYLYGSYSPVNGDSFCWEIEGVDTLIFEKYLYHFSLQKPEELKIVVIDNAGFHSTKNIVIPDNIILLRIPPYTPELNPAEKIWHFIKQRFKNRCFDNIEKVKEWIHKMVNGMTKERIKSITYNGLYCDLFMSIFQC